MANEDQTRDQQDQQDQPEQPEQQEQQSDERAEAAGIAGGHEESGRDPEPEQNKVDPESSQPEVNREGFRGDPTAMTGTVDTTGAGVAHEDVRTATSIFRESDERAAARVEESRKTHEEADSEAERQATEQRELSRKQAHEEKVRAGLAQPEEDQESERSEEESRETTVAPGGTSDPGVADATGAEQTEEEYGSFDPSEHGVDDVNAYLDSLPDDEDGQAEYDRVIQAERDGKARKGILND